MISGEGGTKLFVFLEITERWRGGRDSRIADKEERFLETNMGLDVQCLKEMRIISSISYSVLILRGLNGLKWKSWKEQPKTLSHTNVCVESHRMSNIMH